MKLSMWMIAEWLKDYQPRLNIQEGIATISGVRFAEEGLKEYPRSYVYLIPASKSERSPGALNTIMVVHGEDYLFVNDTPAEVLINEMLTALDFYNNWEASLREVSMSENGLQRMIELSDDVFGHPSRIMDRNGKLLAISKKFGPDDVDVRWRETYETGMVQLKGIAPSIYSVEGERLTEWEESPRQYYTGEHEVDFIAANILVDREIVAAFLMQEHRSSFSAAHCQLADVFCEVLRAALRSRQDSQSTLVLRSKPSLLFDLLEGGSPEEGLEDRFALEGIYGLSALIVMRSAQGETPQIRRGSMLTMIRELSIGNISLDYQGNIVVAVRNEEVEDFLKQVFDIVNQGYYMAGISLPFDGWDDLPVRYRQACLALELNEGIPGVHYCRDYAFKRLLNALSDQGSTLDLCHPALVVLREYDKKQRTNYYETLYSFLAHERSYVDTSKALFIHRNTLMYRIRVISELINSDLEDPDERNFIYFSYRLAEEKSASH